MRQETHPRENPCLILKVEPCLGVGATNVVQHRSRHQIRMECSWHLRRRCLSLSTDGDRVHPPLGL